MSYADGFDAPYYLACGCYSEWTDHRCGPMFDRCNGCGVPDDCMCHESCEPGNACASCMMRDAQERDEAHAEALDALSLAPVLRAGEAPGDALGLAGRGPVPAPWWWGRAGVWEWERHLDGTAAW